MYGGLAAAMRYNDASALRLFGLKNEMDQQAQQRTQLDRQNAIQDQGLLLQKEDRAQAAKDRTRQHGIEDAKLGLLKDEYAQRKEDRATVSQDREAARIKRLQEEGFQKAGRKLFFNGKLSLQDIKDVNSSGVINLAESEDAATVDPETGNLRLKHPDGSQTEMAMGDFLNGVGVTNGVPRNLNDAASRAKGLISLYEGRTQDAMSIAEKIANLDTDIAANAKSRKAALGYFGGENEESKGFDAEGKSMAAERTALAKELQEAKSEADLYQKEAARIAMAEKKAGGGVTYTPAGAGGGLLPAQPAQAPYYRAEGQGGLLPQAAQIAPEKASADLDAMETLLREDAAAKAQKQTAKAQGERVVSDVQRAAVGSSTPPAYDILRGERKAKKMIDKGAKWLLTPLLKAALGEENAPKANPTPIGGLLGGAAALARGVGSSTLDYNILAAWNGKHPDRQMTQDDLDLLRQEAENTGTSLLDLMESWKPGTR